MKRLMAIAMIVLFSASIAGFAKGTEKCDTDGKTVKVESKVKVEKKVKTESKEVKAKGKKTEAPKGVQKAAEKGKGEKKGFWSRWFGGSKDKAADTSKVKGTEKAKETKVKK
jgi:hypothetical protein